MGYKPKDENYLILIIMGICIGFISFYIFFKFNMYCSIAVITLNVLIICFSYYRIKLSFKKKVSFHLSNLTENILKISEGATLPNNHKCTDELYDLYSAIGLLSKNLEKQSTTIETLLKIVDIIAVNTELEKLLDNLLLISIENTKSNWGAFYLFNSITGKLELKSSRGFSKNIYKELDIELGEGYVGQAALSWKVEIIKDIPDDTVFMVRTVLGKLKPRALLTLPIISENGLVALLVLASINDYSREQVELVEMIKDYIGFAISKAISFERTRRLSNELLFQNQLIQNLNEELEDKVKERTDFFEGIINSITDYAISSMDKDGIITMWNQGAELIRGYSKDDVIGKHVSTLYIPEEYRKVEYMLNIAKQEGKYCECSWKLKKDGTRYCADIILSAMYDKKGELTGFTNITKDITTIKNLEQVIMHKESQVIAEKLE